MEKGENQLVDVLLTHSYHLFFDRKQVRKMQPYPPLGTLYAAALLRHHGFSVALFDSMLEDPERGFRRALEHHRPRVVAVYEDNFNFLSKMCLTRMRQVAFGILDAAKDCGAAMVVNGSDASDHLAEYLQRGFDFALLGEAEWTLLDLTRFLCGQMRSEPEEIPGLAFLRPETGELVRTSPRPPMKNLDELPFPARDLVDIERYRAAWKSAHGVFSLNTVASRGCPYHCNWCAKPIYGNSFHIRSPQCVAEEMEQLKNIYGADHLWFADDIFALKPRWALELAQAVECRDAAVPFKIQTRVDMMTEETVSALRRAGCAEIWMGVESGSQRILDAMDKGARVEKVYTVRETLRRHGIRACYFLQFGYPGELWEDIQKTIALVRDTRPDDIGVSVSYPLPGTKFYDRVREELGEKTNWVDSEDLAMMFKGTYTNEFYRALHDALHAELESWNGTGTNASELWAKVERLEKNCRNADPTYLPMLAYMDAGV